MSITLRDVSDNLNAPSRGAPVDGCRTSPISRTIDTAGISFGAAVFSTALPHIATGTPGGAFLGIALADEGVIATPFSLGGALSLSPFSGSLSAADEPARDFYADGQNFSIATAGKVWVLAGETVARNAQAYVTPAGAIVVTASGNTAIPASFALAASSGSLVPLRLGSL